VNTKDGADKSAYRYTQEHVAQRADLGKIEAIIRKYSFFCYRIKAPRNEIKKGIAFVFRASGLLKFKKRIL